MKKYDQNTIDNLTIKLNDFEESLITGLDRIDASFATLHRRTIIGFTILGTMMIFDIVLLVIIIIKMQ